MPLMEKGKGKRIKVVLGESELNVEPAVAEILKASNYKVISGEDVHLASHVLTGKFMGLRDHDTFKNYALHYGYDNSFLDSILLDSENLLMDYLKGNEDVAIQLLENLVTRWDIYYKPVIRKKLAIKVLVKFWMHNREILRKWVEWYYKLPYDPRGAPDLFAWSSRSNDWRWVEVKSARDRLSENQWQWIHGFTKHVSNNVALVRIIPQYESNFL